MSDPPSLSAGYRGAAEPPLAAPAARLRRLGRYGLFLVMLLAAAARPPYQLPLLIRQLHFIGARSLPVIAIAGSFVGMVVALQFYDTLVRFGSTSLLGSAVGLSLIRELGPVLTAIIAIGRAGSATCAEIGIMRSDQQLDALECMAIDPYRFLLAPRLLAFLIAVPLLTAIFDVFGIAGGWLVGVITFDLGSGAYLGSMADSVLRRDVTMGVVKSLVFALMLAWICMGKGFLMRGLGGSEGVSRATTEAVVIASIAVLFTDYIVSALML